MAWGETRRRRPGERFWIAVLALFQAAGAFILVLASTLSLELAVCAAGAAFVVMVVPDLIGWDRDEAAARREKGRVERALRSEFLGERGPRSRVPLTGAGRVAGVVALVGFWAVAGVALVSQGLPQGL